MESPVKIVSILFLKQSRHSTPTRGILCFVSELFLKPCFVDTDGTFSDTTLADNICGSLPFLARGTVLKNSAYDCLPLHTGWVMAINHASFVLACLHERLSSGYGLAKALTVQTHLVIVSPEEKLHWFLPASWKGLRPFFLSGLEPAKHLNII